MKTKPQKGDQIASAGISEKDYLAIGELFLIAGANRFEFPSFNSFKRHAYFGLDIDNDLFHTNSPSFFSGGRLLSVKDLLGDDEEEWKPEIGVECECYWITDTNPRWHRCKILAESEYGLAINYLGDNEDPSWHDIRPKFRSIKSERFIAVEDMASIIARAINENADIPSALYYAGYRKTKP